MNSKKKHNIGFIKPNEPAFITRLKQQAGFIEGPSVDTKKEKLPEFDDEDEEDRDDEKPTVVVMNDGDLTQEEAELFTQIKKEVDAVDKADLSQRVIFKRKNTNTTNSEETSNPKEVKKKKKDKPKAKKTVLSFNDEDEEDV